MASQQLKRVESRRGVLASRRSDARHDRFVIDQMAGGESIVRASMYTQSLPACGLQLGAVVIPVATMGAAAFGLLGGLGIGVAVAAVASTLMLLETSDRIVVTGRSLIVQASFLQRRYERSRIENPRVEVLSPIQWAWMEMSILEPRFFVRSAPGIRFRYRKSPTKTREVFIAVADAHEFLNLIR